MRHIAASIFFVIIVIGGLVPVRQPVCHPLNESHVSGNSATIPLSVSAAVIQLSEYANTTENIRVRLHYDYTHSFKDLAGKIFKKTVELSINNEISAYARHIGSCVIRFNGPEIAHPFDYYW